VSAQETDTLMSQERRSSFKSVDLCSDSEEIQNCGSEIVTRAQVLAPNV